ncbi:hypothetical protein JXQ70_13915 [bacterium]|nr:hypothetical protein [bacterium]
MALSSMTLSSVPRDWARGFRRVDQIYINVSAGLGCEHSQGIPRIRCNCPPEMSLINLLPKELHHGHP